MSAGCTDVLKPLDQSAKLNLSDLPNLNYTGQDFASLKTRLAEYIRERFSSSFSDFVESDLGIMLMEIMAFTGDTLHFKLDQIVNELFIDTVTEVENAFRLSRLVGFKPTPPIAARAFFSATINQALVTDLDLGNAIQIEVSASDGSIYYELFPADSLNNPILEGNVTIVAGSFTNTNIVGLEGRTLTDIITADGGSNQAYTLSAGPVLFDSIRVDVDGNRWRQVDYFTDDQPRNEYRVEFDSDYNAFVIFGNGRAGRSPTRGSEIRVTFRVGGGVRGNIQADTAFSQRSYDIPGLNYPTPVTFRNYTRGEFGYNGDGLDDIRRKLPEYLKTQDRAVTGEDYQLLTTAFVSPYNGQAGKAVAALRNYGCAGNVIDLYVLVRDGTDALAVASDEFKVELSNYLDERKMMTDFVCIRDGVVLPVDVTIDVVVDRFYRKFRDDLDRRLRNKLSEFFSLVNWDFGQNLRDMDIVKAVGQIPEVASSSVYLTTADPDNGGAMVTTKYYEIIRPDQAVINLIFE